MGIKEQLLLIVLKSLRAMGRLFLVSDDEQNLTTLEDLKKAWPRTSRPPAICETNFFPGHLVELSY